MHVDILRKSVFGVVAPHRSAWTELHGFHGQEGQHGLWRDGP